MSFEIANVSSEEKALGKLWQNIVCLLCMLTSCFIKSKG